MPARHTAGPAPRAPAPVSRPTLGFGPPRDLFSSPFVYLGSPSYAVADAGRFLMSSSGNVLGPSEVVLVLDWFSELERLVSTR